MTGAVALQYDHIGGPYERLKVQMPLARHVEGPTLDAVLGDVRGARVLDLACGTGWYSRSAARRGATVLGVDVSPVMIEAARRTEDSDPLGVRYRCADATALPEIGEVDVVSAVWLLCYARDRAELAATARAAFRALRPGGRYAGVEMNPAYRFSEPPATPYGLTHVPLGPTVDGGTPLHVTSHVDPPLEFQAVHWDAAAVVGAFLGAGFEDVAFHAPVFGPRAFVEHDERFWAALRAHPTVLGLRARRPEAVG